MFNPADIIDFFSFLDIIDSVSIEENSNGEDVTLNDIKSANSGNNCLHYVLMHNNHRIVIQTYKDLARKGDVDVVQGKPEIDPDFEHMIDIINVRPQDYTDSRLNKLFVLYCGMWKKCSYFTWGEMDSFFLAFGSDMSCYWADGKWSLNVDNVSLSQIDFILKFINSAEDICNG